MKMLSDRFLVSGVMPGMSSMRPNKVSAHVYRLPWIHGSDIKDAPFAQWFEVISPLAPPLKELTLDNFERGE